MKKPAWIDEFKSFIARGNVLDMAVGVVVGSSFTAIVTAVVENLLKPLVNMILSSFLTMPDENTAMWTAAFLNIFNAVVTFLMTALVVFWIVRIANKMKKKEEAPAPAPEEPKGPTTEELLSEIRDLLKEKK